MNAVERFGSRFRLLKRTTLRLRMQTLDRGGLLQIREHSLEPRNSHLESCELGHTTPLGSGVVGFDPADILYIYQSGPGQFLIFLRVFAACWLTYLMTTSLRLHTSHNSSFGAMAKSGAESRD